MSTPETRHTVTDATLDAYLHDRDADLACECGFRGDEDEMSEHLSEHLSESV